MPETQTQPVQSLWTRDFILISLSNLFLFYGFQMLLPTLPVYIAEHGGSETAVGMVIGIFTIFSLIARPLAGAMLERAGKKRLLAVGLLICLLAIGGYYWMATVAAVLLARCVHGIGWGIATTTSGTIATDVIPAARRGEGIGYFGLASTLAMALAPVTGISLMKGPSGFSGLFAVAVLCTAIALALAAVVRLRSASHPTAAKHPAVSFRSQLVERQALFPSLLGLLVGVTYGSIVSFITLFGKEAGIENVGLFFTTNAVCLFLVRLVAGRIFDRRGHFWVLLPGGIAALVGLLLLSYAQSVPGIMLAAVFYGGGFGAVQPSLQAWIMNKVPPDRRGPANATYYSAFDLGIGGGAMILGPIAGLTSYALMYRFSALLMIVYIAAYLWSIRKSPAGKPAAALEE